VTGHGQGKMAFVATRIGTCQDALDTACGLYLNDPTACA
jgi:hypothetical protein